MFDRAPDTLLFLNCFSQTNQGATGKAATTKFIPFQPKQMNEMTVIMSLNSMSNKSYFYS